MSASSWQGLAGCCRCLGTCKIYTIRCYGISYYPQGRGPFSSAAWPLPLHSDPRSGNYNRRLDDLVRPCTWLAVFTPGSSASDAGRFRHLLILPSIAYDFYHDC